MKIGKKFNQMSKSEYFHYIDNYKKYTDFNTLGLYRSILENKQLSLAEQIEVRDYAHQTFEKTFNFYPVKDPNTYFKLLTLGETLTKGDKDQLWEDIQSKQQEILSKKKIKHRNFGIHSKHICGYEHCSFDGMMVKEGSWLTENSMNFKTDKNAYEAQKKSMRQRKERKSKHRIIRKELDH